MKKNMKKGGKNGKEKGEFRAKVVLWGSYKRAFSAHFQKQWGSA